MKNKVIYSLVTGLLVGGTFLGAGVTADAERLEYFRPLDTMVSSYTDEQGLTIGVYENGDEVVIGTPSGLEYMAAKLPGIDDNDVPTTSDDVNMDYNPSASAPVKLDNSNSTKQSKAQTQTETTAPVETSTENNKSVEEQTVENKDTDTKKKDDSSAKKTKKKNKKEETNKDEGLFLNTCHAVGGFFKSCGKAVGGFFGGIGDFFANLF
jgi:hypothetical protein